MATSCEKQAEAAKRKGNLYFKKEKLGAAIEAYTEAITLCPQVPIYWTNRALCERKRNEWEKVEADCRKALELDNKSVKGHYMLGLALLHYQQYRRAVAELEKALDLGRGPSYGTSYMVQEIWQELAKARYTQWEDDSNVRRQQLQDLQTFLQNLVKLDGRKRLQEITSVMLSPKDSSPPPDELPIKEGTISDDGKIRYPHVDGVEETSTESYQDGDLTGEEKVDGGSRGLYPPIYGQDGGFDRTREDSLREDDQEFVDENSRTQSASVEANSSKGENSEEQEKSNSPVFDASCEKSYLHHRESLRIRLQKFLESENFQPDDAADCTNNFQPKVEVHKISGDEKTPYTMYDIYKVFKELVKLKQSDAGLELLRTTELYERRSKTLSHLFEKLAAPDIPGEVPDHLCCTITMEIFRDPVITPSGITYERAALEEHLKQVGSFDPVTRKPLTLEHVFPNLALRDAVQAYLDDHGWAYRT